MTETTASSADSTAGRGPRTGGNGTAYRVFAGLTALLVLGIVVQFFLAGLGVFGVDGRELEKATSLDPHRALGHILAGIALLMFIAALVARASKLEIWGSLALVVLIELVQALLASGGEDHDWLGGLHALNGLVILGLAARLHMASRPALRG